MTIAGQVTRSAASLKIPGVGLTRAAKVWFRYRAVTHAGMGDWSDATSLVVD